MSRKKKIDLTN